MKKQILCIVYFSVGANAKVIEHHEGDEVMIVTSYRGRFLPPVQGVLLLLPYGDRSFLRLVIILAKRVRWTSTIRCLVMNTV